MDGTGDQQAENDRPCVSDADRRLAVELRVGHLKQMTTLALTASGGVVTLGGSIFSNSDNIIPLWICAGIFALAGFSSFLATSHLIQSLRLGRETPRTARVQELVATIGMSTGFGFFLYYVIKYVTAG